MNSGEYSFIDISVLDEVRLHFAAADPILLLTSDLQTVLYANGPGARLLGFAGVEEAMGGGFDPGRIVQRQIAATPGFPNIEGERSMVLRIERGFGSIAQPCRVRSVNLPGGETGVLLAVSGAGPQGRTADQIAARAISGIGNEGHYAALIDGDGEVLAGTKDFDRLRIAPETINMLIRQVGTERDRLIKRMIPADGGEIAAGIGRLADDPPLHLLVVVAEDIISNDLQVQSHTAMRGLEQIAIATETQEPVAPTVTEPGEGQPVELASRDTDDEIVNTPAEQDNKPEPTAHPDEEKEAAEKAGGAFGRRKNDAAGLAEESSGPLRFVWRTDATGRISAISDEFGKTFGPAAADIIGRSFRAVAEKFGIDRNGEIAMLLEHRDTWSGRTVFWPLEGSDRMAPVDLAALPTYSRDREFEGFRGFGVARLNELAADPERRGLYLKAEPLGAPVATRPSNTEPAPSASLRETPANDPFGGEKPAIETKPPPGPPASDKIVRLSERREPSDLLLSESERSAFAEIASRLKTEARLDEEQAAKTSSGEPAEDKDDLAGPIDPVADSADTSEGTISSTAEKDIGPAAAPEEPQKPAEEPSIAAEIARSGFLPSAFATKAIRPGVGADLSILEQLPVAVLVRSGDILHYANPEFLKLTGYGGIDELSAAGGFDVLFEGPDGLSDDEDDENSARHAMRLITRSGAVRPCEALLRSVRWDGHRALMLAIRPARSDEGEDQLKSRIEELTTILDTATDGVVLITPGGLIRSISRPAEALFGFESSEIAGKPFTSLFAVESQRAANDYLAGLTDNGVASVLNDGREVIGRESRGRFIPMFMTIGKLQGSGGFCAVMRDITHWKRAEEELTQARGLAEHASSQKTGFLARISHEIRTPLNAIIGFSELMIDEKFGPIGNDRYRDYLRDINRSGNHVLDLVNDLLDISKIEAGEQEMKFEAVSLNDALADGVAMLQPEANRERVIIRSSFASQLPEVVADKRSIKQIILNMLSNAIRFTPAGGQVIVSTAYETSGDVVLRVRDTGIGMSRTEIEEALRPFKQVATLKLRRKGGTGLGLPLTKAMVEANRARFRIDSVPDEGTIIEINFPPNRVLAE